MTQLEDVTNFQVITKSNMYPLHFCATQFVENKCIVDIVVQLWLNIKKAMDFWKIKTTDM